MVRVAIVIPTFNGVDRTRFFLDTIKRNDPHALDDVPCFVVEDPCLNLGEGVAENVRNQYDELELDYPVQVFHSEKWLNMHGAARYAFDLAFEEANPDWVVYFGDDLAATKGSVSNLLYFLRENPLETVSLVQPPYWNAQDLAMNCEKEYEGPELFSTKERGFYRNMEWTDKVPLNPHWQEGDGYPAGIARPYVNVNGAGFACKAETYRKVGGFQEGTWCLDETISVKTWLQTGQAIVALPGPPFVHYFGAATTAGTPSHDLHTAERWEEAMGMTKQCADDLCRKAMKERDERVLAEMHAAKYWRAE